METESSASKIAKPLENDKIAVADGEFLKTKGNISLIPFSYNKERNVQFFVHSSEEK